MSHFVHVFKCLDADGGGTIDKPEIMAALKVLNVKASKQEIEAMICHVDPKNTGVCLSFGIEVFFQLTLHVGEMNFEQFLELMTDSSKKCGALSILVNVAVIVHPYNMNRGNDDEKERGLSMVTFPLLVK
jgi:Ca2+-binding EF-hand superfamily protein